jgi:hypothetical protein
MYGGKGTIWYATLRQWIIGLYLIDDEDGNTLAIDQKRYQTLVFTSFLDDIKQFSCDSILCLRMQWFQQEHI